MAKITVIDVEAEGSPETIRRTVRAINRVLRQSARKKVKSWWGQPCSQEVYSLRCKYCGKSEAEES